MRRIPILLVCAFLLAIFVTAATPCTGLLLARAGRVLAGNNEDFWNPDTRMWFVPAEEPDRHGRVYFGFGNHFPQGGMNEAGLFFDGFATEALPITTMEGREFFAGNLIDEALSRCATVDELLELLSRYDLSFLEKAMLMFADRNGDSVILEGDDLVRKQGDFQISTNFYQSRSEPEEAGCKRYAAAQRVLTRDESASVELVREALAAAHIEVGSPTQYSNIYDLEAGLVYLYHFHDFQEVLVIDLAEELKKGKHSLRIPELFPESFAFGEYRREAERKLERRRSRRRAKDYDASNLADYAGSFVGSSEHAEYTITLRVADGRLLAQVEEWVEAELMPDKQGPDTFFRMDYLETSTATFTRDDDNLVIAMQWDTGYGVVLEMQRTP